LATRHATLFEVALVLFLLAIEFAGRGDLRRNRALKFLAGFEICLGFFRDGFLFRRVRENRRAILRAEVRSLAIYLSRIVHVPERFDKRFVAHFLRIKSYLHNFRMASFVGANILVRVIFGAASAITGGLIQ